MKKPKRFEKSREELFQFWDELPVGVQHEIVDAYEYHIRLQKWKAFKAQEQSK